MKIKKKDHEKGSLKMLQETSNKHSINENAPNNISNKSKELQTVSILPTHNYNTSCVV